MTATAENHASEGVQFLPAFHSRRKQRLNPHLAISHEPAQPKKSAAPRCASGTVKKHS